MRKDNTRQVVQHDVMGRQLTRRPEHASCYQTWHHSNAHNCSSSSDNLFAGPATLPL